MIDPEAPLDEPEDNHKCGRDLYCTQCDRFYCGACAGDSEVCANCFKELTPLPY